MVTARNREELLQSVPLAVFALSGRDLELGQVGTTDQLAEIMPNVNFNHSGALSGTKSAAQFYIRGVGQRDFLPVTDPGVAVYVDGVYVPRSVGAMMDLIDVERVEVLRGPQGTLFGRNAIGGAVSVHSRRPDAEARRSIRAQFGDDRMTNLTASANGALGDGLFGSVALALRKRDGYVRRIHDGLDMGNDNGQAARGAIMWRPSATFEVFGTADYSRRRENGAPTVNGGVNDKQAFGTFGNAALPGCTAIAVNPDFPGKGPPTFPPPGQGAGGAEGCYGPDSFAGEYISEGTFPAFADLDSWGAGARVSWSPGGGVTLRSLTGYRGLDMWNSRDADN
ncbi:MAG: TonB-dependent receptor plug domain-containing protein, partial [Gemmatimonadota bacterium]|nr:TonB-dependent receptor plug domain-containing protein [Gemmatimonadota bacterium]